MKAIDFAFLIVFITINVYYISSIYTQNKINALLESRIIYLEDCILNKDIERYKKLKENLNNEKKTKTAN